MISSIIIFISGVFAGITIFSLLTIASRADDDMERRANENTRDK